VTTQWESKEFQPYKAAFPESVRDSSELLISHCQQLASKDIKDPAWKKLQGLIWRQGYADGVLSVPLYKDVAPVLRSWHEKGIHLAIYSSGSVEAQKLFFRYVDPDADLSNTDEGGSEGEEEVPVDYKGSEEVGEPRIGEKRKAADIVDVIDESVKKSKIGSEKASLGDTTQKKVQTEDLNALFAANFDTINAGPKTVAGSYHKILKELEKTAENCLFLSDNVKGK
jgi:enolase-phosphatase E1